MLIDNVSLTIKAGNGGNGSASLLHNGLKFKGGPDGGNGGNGGNIYFQGSNNINDLREFRFKKKFTATDGIKGKHQKLFGKNAPHITIFVPLGTKITEIDSRKTYEITETTIPVLAASGGKGGRGNVEFKSATNQTPIYAEKGVPGEEKKLLLEMRLIADIGLIGLPNAGKSSLLAVLTNATPKIGDYPFTTLEPNIGMFGQHPIADIPGLVEGAASGRGLGANFLKHIEKTKIIVHCIELNGDDPQKGYEKVRREFENYNASLLDKPEIILLTKSDLVDDKTIKKYIAIFKKMGKITLACSLLKQESIDALKQKLEKSLTTL